jgi:hypothetical protein
VSMSRGGGAARFDAGILGDPPVDVGGGMSEEMDGGGGILWPDIGGDPRGTLFVLPAGETSLSRADPDREGDAEGVCSAVSEEMRLAYVGLKNRWV